MKRSTAVINSLMTNACNGWPAPNDSRGKGVQISPASVERHLLPKPCTRPERLLNCIRREYVYCSVFWSPDRLHLKPDRFTDQTGRLTSANRLNCHFCLKFEFVRFFSVTGQTGPVHRNWWVPVSSDRSVKKKPWIQLVACLP